MSVASLHTVHLQDSFRRMHAGDAVAEDELLCIAGDGLERLARRILRDFPSIRRCADTGEVFKEVVLRLLRSLLFEALGGQLPAP